ncbi:MAG: Electron transport complex subunit RsxB [Firmicutes bacterium ADurb.Bin356]|nr:MAG: Electron transport complex subunit RsxB [Firmicutes bacterium ADurb.Bin356]
MKLCILSGKGGTGKTTLAVNLAYTLNCAYYDCDVEEPNGFIFLNPMAVSAEETLVDYPCVDYSLCTLCKDCVTACQFNALAATKKEILLFKELCHGCHACSLACSEGAITFAKRAVGVVEKGRSNGIFAARGVLNIGEPMAVPVIKHLLKQLKSSEDAILDCAPGTSCNAVTTLRHADAALIVTEPTVFGLNDMEIAVELLNHVGLPFAALINKSRGEDSLITEYCGKNGINLLGVIPFSKEAAIAYSKGKLLLELPEYKLAFEALSKQLKEAFAWN